MIRRKNYLILIVLILFTVLLTLFLSNIYINKDRQVSDFYIYSNKILPNEFEQYMVDNSDLIIYISDKYDLSNSPFESKFENKLNELNLKSNLVYIDKNDINNDFLEKLKNDYEININLKNCPIIIVVVDKKVIKTTSVLQDSNIDTIIDYEVFK